VNVVRLDCRGVVDLAVFADAAAEAARVTRDDRAIREVRRQRAEAAGVHRLRDHEQRRASVRGGQRAMDVIDDVGPGGYKLVRRHISIDVSRVESSSVCGGRLETSDGLRLPDDVQQITIQAWTLLWPSGPSHPSSRRISF